MSLGFDVDQDYFHWLCEQICVEQPEKSYWLLAKDLHRSVFYSLVPHDENRAADGIALREEYLSEINAPKYIRIDGECSVLEMLIGLARRMDFETGDAEHDTDATSLWFWEMIVNLGLDEYSDDNYVRNEGVLVVDTVIEHFLERDYRWDGLGGLFPLNSAEEDQRKVEIWYQMNAYLTEKEVV